MRPRTQRVIREAQGLYFQTCALHVTTAQLCAQHLLMIKQMISRVKARKKEENLLVLVNLRVHSLPEIRLLQVVLQEVEEALASHLLSQKVLNAQRSFTQWIISSTSTISFIPADRISIISAASTSDSSAIESCKQQSRRHSWLENNRSWHLSLESLSKRHHGWEPAVTWTQANKINST